MKPIRILFVCHGNICRSPMAEFVLRDLVEKRGLSSQFIIASAATSTEELGNPVHRGTRDKLAQHNIAVDSKIAVQLTKHDYDVYDYLIGMDSQNIANIKRITGKDGPHICRLLDFTSCPRDIADPWYTGDFDRTYNDILSGCQALLEFLLQNR